MVDPKIQTLLTLVQVGNYTKTAKILSLTQPAVSHQIKQLEEEYGIKIFYNNKKVLTATTEGKVFIKYARRIMSIAENARQALDDCKKSIQRFSVGITGTLSEHLVSKVFAQYCNDHPHVNINIVTDNINNIYDKLQTYELDWAIIEGSISNNHYTTVLLDTDYLCLVVSPHHKFASRKSVSLLELKKEKFVLRSANAGTRLLFENHLLSHSEDIKNFNIVIEIDNISTIKELVEANLGVSILAHSVCIDEERLGKLVIVPIENFNMTREINIVYHSDFEHTEIVNEIRNIYNSTN